MELHPLNQTTIITSPTPSPSPTSSSSPPTSSPSSSSDITSNTTNGINNNSSNSSSHIGSNTNSVDNNANIYNIAGSGGAGSNNIGDANNISNIVIPTGNITIQRTIEKDIMLSLGKHIVITSSTSNPTLKSFNDLIEFIKIQKECNNPNTHYWIELQSLSEDEITEICRLMDIHTLTISDINKQETREKCDFFPNHLYVIVNEIHYEDGSNNLVSGCLNMLLFKNMIFTIHHRPLISTSQVMRMIKYSPSGNLPSAAWIIYAYLDCISDIYIDLVDKLMMEVQSLDDLLLVLGGMKQNELFTRIGMAGRRVISLHSGVFGKSEIISGLLRDEKLVPHNMFRYLRNVQDHVYRMLQKLTLSQRLLANINNIYMARMSLEVSQSSNLVNRSMRKFTAVSIIFVPLSLITGIFGMNVRLPAMVGLFPGGDDYYFFIGLMITMFLIGCSSAFLFRRSGWI